MRKSFAGIALALSTIFATFVAAPTAEAHHLRTYLNTRTNTGEFHAGEASYYAIRTKASAASGKGIRGKAVLYLDGERQRTRYLRSGSIMFRIYRDELRDNRYVTVSVRILPKMDHRQDRIIRKEIIDTSRAMRVVAIARDQVGDPYRWGAGGPGAFDCSGLVQYAYRHATGIYLPHSSTLQSRLGRRVSSPRVGDLVWIPGHIAIYSGNGRVIEAANRSTGVVERRMWQRGARYIRILG